MDSRYMLVLSKVQNNNIDIQKRPINKDIELDIVIDIDWKKAWTLVS